MCSKVDELKNEINKKRNELYELENQLCDELQKQHSTETSNNKIPEWSIERYCRQLLISQLGTSQFICEGLMKSSVLIIGLGGLGCPASAYLAAAGIGCIGLLDFDEVDRSNLARQILHSEICAGLSKVDSAEASLKRINHRVKYVKHEVMLDSENALNIFKDYDVVLDCTDNVATRYLVNDACVLTGKPLVSASALKMEGQISVYNGKSSQNPNGGPCFRCIFPEPPPPEAVGSCSLNGILGPVVGVMGSLQALETIKLLLGKASLPGRMVIFDGMEVTARNLKLRNKNPKCAVCSENPTIKALVDYPAFCNSQVTDKDFKLELLKPDERISALELSKSMDEESSSLLVDVRPRPEFEMYKLDNSVNYPYDDFIKNMNKLIETAQINQIKEVFFICRRGNDSQRAVRDFKAYLREDSCVKTVKDVEGGLLYGWKKLIDPNVPTY